MTPVHLYFDGDADGLPDSWELTQFGHLDALANEDSDNDGVSNAEEFEDGTNPDDPASRFVRLTVLAKRGYVTVLPYRASGRYAPGSVVNLVARPQQGYRFQRWTGDASSDLPGIALTLNAHATIEALFYRPDDVVQAVDGGVLAWQTGGDLPWIAEGDETAPQGTSLVRSGPILHGQSSWIETTVTGPGTATWEWYVSSEYRSDLALGDQLRCEINGHRITLEFLRCRTAYGACREPSDGSV